MTQGEKLVGVTFNPSGDEKIYKIKQKIAEAIDIICEEDDTSKVKEHFSHLAIDHLLIAQMIAVKAITWKD